MVGKFLTRADVDKILTEFQTSLYELLEKPMTIEQAADFLSYKLSYLRKIKEKFPHHVTETGSVYFYASELNRHIKGVKNAA